MVNKPLIRPYFWGGYVRGGTLTSHDRNGRVDVWKFSKNHDTHDTFRPDMKMYGPFVVQYGEVFILGYLDDHPTMVNHHFGTSALSGRKSKPGVQNIQTTLYVRSGLNSHYFHIIGDGHQPNSRGL